MNLMRVIAYHLAKFIFMQRFMRNALGKACLKAIINHDRYTRAMNRRIDKICRKNFSFPTRKRRSYYSKQGHYSNWEGKVPTCSEVISQTIFPNI